MKTIVRNFGISVLLLAAALHPLLGASVGPEGHTNRFDTRPLVADWSSLPYQGAAADVYSPAEILLAVAPSVINRTVWNGGTNDPPSANALAIWTSANGGYICTRPSGYRCTMVQAILVNDTGTNATGVRISYDFDIKGGTPEPDNPGLRAFYNVTGLTNGWVPIPEFSSPDPVAGTLTADLTLTTPWMVGTNFFVLWMDDNADMPGFDPAYALDNFSVAVTAGTIYHPPFSVTLTSPTNTERFFAPSVISIVADTPPFYSVSNVTFFADGAKLGELTAAPFTFEWSNPPMGWHTLTAVATDETGSNVQSAPIAITVHDASGSPLVQITAPAEGWIAQGPTNVIVAAMVNTPEAVTNVAFLANDVLVANDTASPYSVAWNAPFGASALTAVATDINGLQGTSAVINVVITYPPTNTVAPVVVAHTPASDVTVSNLSGIQVTFSETVVNVDASDLLLNGVSAVAVSGSGTNYVFLVDPPSSGPAMVTWAPNHGITDVGWPAALAFDATASNAIWSFNFVNLSPPAAVVGPGGYANGFATRPLATDWATLSRAGSGGDNYDMDAEVNDTVNAASITNRTLSDTGNPPAANALATWSSTGAYLQTRPTGNRFTALLARFLNDTGTNATAINLSFLLTIGGTAVTEDTGRGTHVYYSLTGETNSWSPLATLHTTASTGSFPLSTNLALTWTNGGSLYLLWADDNANGGTDVANQIGDFALKVTAGAPPSFLSRVTAPVPDELMVSGQPVLATAIAAHGIAPYTVQYFISSGAGNATFSPAGSSTNAPYEVNLGTLSAGTYNLYAVATDSGGTPASTNSMTNTFFVADPMVLTLTSPADGATFDNTMSVSSSATVTGGTAPYSIQFYLDDLAFGEPVTIAPYQRVFGPLFVGDHFIRASVTDCKGWVSNSLASVVRITGPLGVLLSPTNGALLTYGEVVELVAAPGGGTAPYAVTFHFNDQMLGIYNAAPFTTNLGILSVGSYTSYVHATDVSIPTQTASSTTNVFTVVSNPLLVTLTTPTNGQSVNAGQALALAASATVAAPLGVSSVQFYVDGTSVGADTSAPYTGLAILSEGSHGVYAVATDHLGRQSYSATNHITATFPPGGNDYFTNAYTLVGPMVTVTGNNSTASKEFFSGEPSVAGNFGGASLWWTWTPSASGATTIDTTGSDFNTLLGVYTGTALNALTAVASNNDYDGNAWSRVEFNAVAGTTYRIVVDGFASGGFPPSPARGNIVLHIKGVGGLELVTPTNGMVFTAGDPIPVAAITDSSFPNPPAVRADFYRSGYLFASVTNEPFSVVATNVPAGSNSFYVIATDSLGLPVQSPVVNVFVQSIGVTLLSPAEDTMFLTANPVAVTAWTYLPSGTITNVEFFVDGLKFGEDNTAPFGASWSNVVSGSHRLTAIGRADTGASYASQPVNIGVASTLMPYSSVWKYRDDGYDQGTSWIAPDFDDSAWASGPAPLGYSDSSGRLPATTNSFGPESNNKFQTTYYRQALVINNPSAYERITMNIERDDGAIVYLNGNELARFNMPTGVVSYTNWAAANASDDGATVFSTSLSPGLFVDGTNVFAVEIHQDAANSSDIWFQMQLVGRPVIIHNLFPTVAVTDPTNGQYFLAPSSLTLAAVAADGDGSVVKVEFLVDGVKVGESTSAPYSVAWNNPPEAAHVLTAVATDDLGATTTSAPVTIVVYDAAGTPVAAITSPPDGIVMEGPTNLLVTATANAIAGVTNVMFLDYDQVIGSDDTAPYSVNWSAPFLTRQLRTVAFDANGVRGTSPVVQVTITIPPTNTIAPTIAGENPPADSTITNLTSVQVTFSQRVVGVDAGDLLVNGVAATNVLGGGSNYVFTFTQPAYGLVRITWSSNSAIHDLSWPVNLPFYDENPDNYWTYDLIDRTPPTIIARTPAAGATLTNLTQIDVTFSEAVAGVDAADLLINGVPAYDVEGHDAVYAFSISQPASGTLNVTWATNHGIVDLAPAQNPFFATAAGATWTYTLDAKTILIQSNSYWFFVQGTNEASSPTDAWRMLGFDDSGWSNAPAPFFYGDPYSNGVPAFTLLSDMRSNYTSIYFRKELVVPNASGITNLFLRAQIDDGMIVWINGVEVLRTNVPAGEIPYNGTAAGFTVSEQNGVAYVNYGLPDPRSYLVSGTNVIAVHAFNESLSSSSDFGFNAQLYTYQANTEAVAPHVAWKDPEPGYVLTLTNLTVTFSEPVTNVEAADLLINGVAASLLTAESNTMFTFSFPQPAFGAVSIRWATNHGILDLDIQPKPFNAGLPGATWGYVLLNANSPYLLSIDPAASTTMTALTQIALTFSEPITGVDATDLLLNGQPATSLGGTGTNYIFTFPQPAYGPVYVTWATNHGIQDLNQPPEAFDELWPSHTWIYTLVDRIPPTVAGVDPSPGSLVFDLTQLTLSFTEQVTGVNAADLLINGQPAASVTGSNAVYTFTFRQPNAGLINITWAANHGIRDLATVPNAFDATAAGATWSYPTVDNVPPSLSSVVPLPGSTVRSLRRVVVAFDEPVLGVDTTSLTINGAVPTQVTGSAAGPYTFEFDQPATGLVQIALSPPIWDLAPAVNQFPGSNWTCVLNPNLPPPTITRGPYLQQQTTNSIIVRWRTATATDSSVQYWLEADSSTNSVNDVAVTTEHVIILTNLAPNTRYEYAFGTTDGGLVVDTNFQFRTAPPIGSSGPTRVWFISDYGFKDSGEASVRDSYFNYVAPTKPADVWLTGGDNDQTDGSDANAQIAVFGTTYGYGNLLRNTPIWPTIGNHDYMTGQGTPYYANFSLPANGEVGGVPSGTEQYYSFDYNNIHFVSLDSIVGTLSASANTAMTEWLRQDLAATTQRWIIAYWHGGPYTKASHDSDSTTDTLAWMVRMRENIVPILESYGVDLVLNGHSHAYERTWPINGHYGFSTTFSETNKVDAGDGRVDGTGAYLKAQRGPGTVYVTAAVGGQLQNRMSVQHPAHLLKIVDALGSLVIDVEGDRLDVQFVNTSGVALDHFTISKAAQTLAGAPTGLTATRLTNNQVRLTWNNSATNEMGYVIERSSDGRNFNEIATVAANVTHYFDTAVSATGSWVYRISSWNMAGRSTSSTPAAIGLQPALSIASMGGTIIILWPASLPGQLQSSSTAGPGAVWETVVEQPAIVGALKVCTIPLTPEKPVRFFRLDPAAQGPEPILTVGKDGNDMVVSWPASAAGYELESSTVLGPAATWQPVTEGITTVGNLRACTVSPGAAIPVRYFRLRKP